MEALSRFLVPATVTIGRGVVSLQYTKGGKNGPVSDEKRPYRLRFRPTSIRMHAAQPFLITCSEIC